MKPLKELKEQLMDALVDVVKSQEVHPNLKHELGGVISQFFPTMRPEVLRLTNPARFGNEGPETRTANTWVHPNAREAEQEGPAPVKKNIVAVKEPGPITEPADDLPFGDGEPVKSLEETTIGELKQKGPQAIYVEFFGGDLKRLRNWMKQELKIAVKGNSREKATLEALEAWLNEN